MFVRLVFLLLLALDLGAGAWLLFGHEPSPPPPPVTDPGVPALRLVSESAPPIPPSARTRAPVPAPAAAPAHASTPASVATVAAPAASAPSPAAAASAPPTTAQCRTLGPFTTTADMRAAMATLTPHVARIQYREQPVSRSHGYWVYLPPTATREQALDEARKLAAKGIRDYYVVTAGDAQNTVSLGLYNDESNAQNRVATLRKDGFAPQVKQRIETEPGYWIDYAVAPGTGFDWRAWLPGRNDLEARPATCF